MDDHANCGAPLPTGGLFSLKPGSTNQFCDDPCRWEGEEIYRIGATVYVPDKAEARGFALADLKRYPAVVKDLQPLGYYRLERVAGNDHNRRGEFVISVDVIAATADEPVHTLR